MKRMLAISLAALSLVGCLTGCQKTPTEAVKIDLNEVTHSVFYAPQYAAIEKGFFAEAGLDVTLTNGGGADNVMTAVLSGQSQIGLAGPEACVYVSLEGKKDSPKIFAQLTSCDGSFLVGRTAEPDFDWANLAGKTIIGGRKGGIPEMTLEYVMGNHGVTPQTDAVVDTAIEFNMMAGSFSGGYGDYVALFEPTATQLELEGKGYVVASVGESSGEIPYTAYFASQSYMKENGETVQAFTDAVAKGLKWVNETDDRLVAETIAPQFPDTDIEVLTAVVARYKSICAWSTSPVMAESAMERLQDVIENAGELKARVPFDSVVDNSFAEKSVG